METKHQSFDREEVTGVDERSESEPVTLRRAIEVPAKPVRRQFSGSYKRRIVEEAEKYRDSGEMGAFLRREGLYWSQLAKWRSQYHDGGLVALTDNKRGRKQKEVNPLEKKVRELEKQNRRLQKKLAQAEIIIDIQKKVAAMLGNDLSDEES